MENKEIITEKEKYLNERCQELLSYGFISNKEDFNLKCLDDIDVVGFDIDFTLSIYNKYNLTKLCYESFMKYLVEEKNYPKCLLSYEQNKKIFDKFAGQFVLLDAKRGNNLKINSKKEIIVGYHGTKQLTEEEIKKQYNNNIFDNYTFGTRYVKDEFYISFDSFELHIPAMYVLCVDFFDRKILPKSVKNYEMILNDILGGFGYNFGLKKEFSQCKKSGYYYPEIWKKPKKYLSNYKPIEILKLFKSKGKKLFLATNSVSSYADYILKNTIGSDYQNYFDLCFFKAMKPFFFQNPKDCKCLNNKKEKVDCINGMDDHVFKEVQEGENIFYGGHYNIIEKYYEKLLGKKDIKYCFIGDNIIGDCKVPGEIKDWRGIFIFDGFGDIKNKLCEDIEREGEAYEIKEKSQKLDLISEYYKDYCIMALPDIDGLKYFI